MASYHFEINSGKKGSVLEHARYITREGKFSSYVDLVDTGYGNLPVWAGDDPIEFWRAAEKYERENGSIYREYEIAFPIELDHEQHRKLAKRLVERVVGAKPYLYAIHEPLGKLGGVNNPHMHLMFSDRLPDGIDRCPQQTFSRYNPQHPERGGRKKDSGGKNRMELRDAAREQRRLIAEIQNEILAEVGAIERVDHRSYKERGIEATPERHLGAAKVKHMSEKERNKYVADRRGRAAANSGQAGRL